MRRRSRTRGRRGSKTATGGWGHNVEGWEASGVVWRARHDTKRWETTVWRGSDKCSRAMRRGPTMSTCKTERGRGCVGGEDEWVGLKVVGRYFYKVLAWLDQLIS